MLKPWVGGEDVRKITEREPFSEITRCRICGNTELASILNLGYQSLTGVFPKDPNRQVFSAPLELVKCVEDGTSRTCGLVQLRHTTNPKEMFGPGYGYCSGINQTMTSHLHSIVEEILKVATLEPGDLVLDIGSNDGTLLKAYPNSNLSLVGFDPSGEKFQKFYPDHIRLIVDFFSLSAIHSVCGKRKAKVITSIAMFYDLDAPMDFVAEVRDLLAEDGIWVFEQSYMPTMLDQTAYDAVCHEHLAYYGLRQIEWMMNRVGLKMINVTTNSINGGSFRVTATKRESAFTSNSRNISALLAQEQASRLNAIDPYHEFRDRAFRHKEELTSLIDKFNRKKQLVLGYGASTKGNVLLQFCGFTPRDIPAIADRNPEKWGLFTPGTKISIISEEEARLRRPSCFLALPWHFKDEFCKREKSYVDGGGRLLFPLPTIYLYGGTQ